MRSQCGTGGNDPHGRAGVAQIHGLTGNTEIFTASGDLPEVAGFRDTSSQRAGGGKGTGGIRRIKRRTDNGSFFT